MSTPQLCLHHELMLLILDDLKGSLHGTSYQYGLAGAIISELLLQGVIKVSDDEKKMVTVAISTAVGDPLLDEVVKMISEAAKPHDMKHWVSKVATLKELHHRIAKQLCDLEILSYDESKVLWLFTQKRYPEIDGTCENAIRSRMAEAMFSQQKPDTRTAVAIALAHSSGALAANFPKVELTQHKERIQEICDGKLLASGATVEVIAAVNASLAAAMIASNAAIIAATTAS